MKIVRVKSKTKCVHYSDVIMSAMASQITVASIFLLNRLQRRRSKKTSKLRVTGLCEGHPSVTGGIHRSSIGRPFRSPLRRRRNMAALPLPAAILDDLIPSFLVPGMRSSKMAAGSGRAAILRLRLNGDRKGRPKSWLTSFPAPPSWIQDGGATSNVWRTS